MKDGTKIRFSQFPVLFINVEVIDQTGAGDCFIGGITGFLSQSSQVSFESIKSAIDYGTSLASFNVENMATKNLLNLSMSDIENRINKLK